MRNRAAVLEDLIAWNQPLAALAAELAEHDWDSTEELVTLRNSHVRDVLIRYTRGEVTAPDVEQWANLLEGRDDIAFSGGRQGKLGEIVHALANPELEGDLTGSRSEELILRLQHNT
ncbi:MAG: hypothetical protein ACJ79K_05050 [Gemmatimonadaceae bacterium]